MNCPNTKRLCDNLIVSVGVTFTGGNLVINLPAMTYTNGHKYCIVVAQTIPTETVIGAPVVFTIGNGTTTYPLLTCNCGTVTACAINTRTRYSTIVHTDIGGGAFKLMGKIPCSQCANNIASLPVAETTG